MATTNPPSPAAKPRKFKPLVSAKDATRLKQLAVSTSDTFNLDPRIILREEGFNQRFDFGELDSLMEDVLANSVQSPLTVRKVGTKIYLVNGDRRLTCVERLIAAGRWPEDPKRPGYPLPVPCVSEKQGVTTVDRYFAQLSLNNGLPFSLLEKGFTYARIQSEDPAVTGTEISRRTGETKQAVSDALRLVNEANPELIQQVRNGKISASAVLQIVKQAGKDHVAQSDLYAKALLAAVAAGREKVLPKDIPTPPDLIAGIGWKYHEDLEGDGIRMFAIRGYENTEHFPHLLRMTRLPDGQKLDFGWKTHSDGTVGYHLCALSEGMPTMGPPSSPRGLAGETETVEDALESGLTNVAPHFKWTKQQVAELKARALDAIPEPGDVQSKSDPKLPEVTFDLSIPPEGYDFNINGVCTNPITCDITGFPKSWSIGKLGLRFAKSTLGWHFGYNFAYGSTSSSGAPNVTHSASSSFSASAEKAWDQAVHFFRSNLDNESTAYRTFPLLKASYDEAIGRFTKAYGPDGGDTATEEPTKANWKLYIVENAPIEALANGDFHEADRLVLENLPVGISRLHLLSTEQADKFIFGYRINDVEVLPTHEDGFTEDLDSAYLEMLSRAFGHLDQSIYDAEFSKLSDALTDAIFRYFPESGTPEQPEIIQFVEAAPAPQETGYDRIKAAASTNRDGSAAGPGNGGGFVAPDKRLKDFEALMESIASKGNGQEPRINTAELVVGYIKNEVSPETLRKHLTGES